MHRIPPNFQRCLCKLIAKAMHATAATAKTLPALQALQVLRALAFTAAAAVNNPRRNMMMTLAFILVRSRKTGSNNL